MIGFTVAPSFLPKEALLYQKEGSWKESKEFTEPTLCLDVEPCEFRH